jgi:hypothetical protein
MSTKVGLQGTIGREVECEEERSGKALSKDVEEGLLVSMVNRLSKERKVGEEDGYYTSKLGALILVGNPGEMVGTKIETSLELHEFEPEAFLLQDEISGDGEELEGRHPLSIVPLAVSVGED